ncbi:MAG TPA: AMP-binding protein, partial [Acidimicrobiia bacterium]|nr:AMP-binding protein [Acidimicrobiia bacterium]
MTPATAALADVVRREGSIAGLLRRRAEEYGEKALLTGDAGRHSYRQVDEMANAVANTLLRLGLAGGDRIGVMMANSAEWVAIWLGAAKVGVATVTINTAYKGDGLAYQLGHSAVKILAVDGALAPRVEALRSEMALPALFVGGDEVGAAGAAPLKELLSGPVAAPPDPGLGPNTPMSILYTSGTTGPPKGCLLPHGQYLAAAHLHADNCGYGPDTVLYTCLPLFHINAQNYSLLSALAAGATLALDRKFTASQFWDRLVETGATAFNFIGSMPLALWNQPLSPAEQRHAARVAFGVPIPLNIWEQWEQRFNCRVVYAYGMTENALPAIFPL